MTLSLEHRLRSLIIYKSVITKTLSSRQVFLLQPTLRVDNGKAALTLHHLKEHFLELNLDVVDNSNIKVKHIGQEGLLLKPKGKVDLL